ncbi:LysR family transcriptional regulator [Pelagibius sp. Alg239-R121]|uniref:LysR family transcriptional regulator n=1 Tax=Pelagibius sp. Alg239-R121 TaxID=2993448 RepID=UPI0024A76311|nr:LysR family transcriptional regulator [Pelagibius sp. Alg239-R121]
MNTANLQTFLAIVETGSLVRASERLNVTQSAVTARLRSLEDELGQTLLNRQKSGATLTASGTRFLRYAQVMTGLWRQARQETALPEGTESVCNFGCHVDLWPGAGKIFFDQLYRERPQMALSAWQGVQSELDQWMGAGLIDAALAYEPTARGKQTIHTLRADRLLLCSDRADTPIRFDPRYIYVDLGEEFRNQHAAAYADAGTARVTFGCAAWALEFLLANGGSAYLPEHMARTYLASSRLFTLTDAPVFTRNSYLITNDATAGEWPWLKELLDRLSAKIP